MSRKKNARVASAVVKGSIDFFVLILCSAVKNESHMHYKDMRFQTTLTAFKYNQLLLVKC